MMEDESRTVREYYDAAPEAEWNRLEKFTFEFEITKYMMEKYIGQGASILDIGGGPGRYSLYFSSRGCDVTLVDLSGENVRFALRKAKETDLPLLAYQADARDLSRLPLKRYDAVFVMGPMYHLFRKEDRMLAICQAMNHLKKGGFLFVSFIGLFAGVSYYLSECPGEIVNDPAADYFDCIAEDRTWCGKAFTEAVFINPDEIVPFMAECGLEKAAFFGQEGITSCDDKALRALPDAERNFYLELSKKLCEKEKYMSHSSHLMYIGRADA